MKLDSIKRLVKNQKKYYEELVEETDDVVGDKNWDEMDKFECEEAGKRFVAHLAKGDLQDILRWLNQNEKWRE